MLCNAKSGAGIVNRCVVVASRRQVTFRSGIVR